MAAWSKFVFSILRTECRDQFPSYCRERIARHPRKSACNKHGSKMCPKSCGVCGKWRKTFLYAEDEVLIFATFWWWIINWTMKNSRSRLVIRNAISELIEQLTRHAAPCLVGPSASFTRAVFVGYWVHLRAGKSQLLFFCLWICSTRRYLFIKFCHNFD